MQIKEVSKRTGLTVKTIRFYEARGLIAPLQERRNGRSFRDYREEDVAQLQMVAVLRKCLFSIEQIKTMLEHPELTPDIFTEYREVLLAQRDLLQVLAEKAETVEPESLKDPETLVEKMTAAAEPLPLPKIDVHPRFRYLDGMSDIEWELAQRKKMYRKKQSKENVDMAMHVAMSGAQYRKACARDLGPGNEQRFAILQMLHDNDE